ncbi:MAG: DNA primase, partial [Bacteroidota bacterium]
MIINAQQIIEAVNVYDVLKDFIDLKKRGTSYTGCCPFHDEKTPSFSVSPVKNIYKCFGCGAGGNAVTFLMEHEKMSFPEAIKRLSQYCNIAVEYKEMTEKEKSAYELREKDKAASYVLMRQINKYYYAQTWAGVSLLDSENVIVDNRVFTWKTIQAFQISFAPNGTIIKNISEQQWSKDQLLKIGIVKSGEKGAYDFFRDRTLFPVFDAQGKICGFSGRKLSDNINKQNPKYINTPETAIYNKAKLLFGLYQSRKAIQKRGRAYLTEGATDVISLHNFGIENVVAPCGTALTRQQVKLLKRFTNFAVLLYDGDKAGKKAIEKNTPMLLKEGMKVRVVILPDGEDPDSFIRRVGTKMFKDYCDSKLNQFDPIYWIMEQNWEDREDPFEKEYVMDLAASLLSYIPSSTVMETYLKAL